MREHGSELQDWNVSLCKCLVCEREHNIGVETKRKRKMKDTNQRFIKYRHRRLLWAVLIHSITPFHPVCLTSHFCHFKYQCLAVLLGLFSSGTLSSILNWYTSVKWVPVTTAWRVVRLRMEKRPPIWRVAANKLNKQSRTADEWWSSSLVVGRGANNPPRENPC
jgi:hypothetical protein